MLNALSTAANLYGPVSDTITAISKIKGKDEFEKDIENLKNAVDEQSKIINEMKNKQQYITSLIYSTIYFGIIGIFVTLFVFLICTIFVLLSGVDFKFGYSEIIMIITCLISSVMTGITCTMMAKIYILNVKEESVKTLPSISNIIPDSSLKLNSSDVDLLTKSTDSLCTLQHYSKSTELGKPNELSKINSSESKSSDEPLVELSKSKSKLSLMSITSLINLASSLSTQITSNITSKINKPENLELENVNQTCKTDHKVIQ
jgi:hypothetical protein